MCDEMLCGLIFCRMGNSVGWAYMLPIEAVLESITKYWQSLRPDLPSPKVVIPCGMSYSHYSTLENDEILLVPGNGSKTTSEAPNASEWTDSTLVSSQFSFPKKKEEGNFGSSDDSRRLITFNEPNAWTHKAILSLGETLRS